MIYFTDPDTMPTGDVMALNGGVFSLIRQTQPNGSAAFTGACETEPMPLGIFDINAEKTTFEENISAYRRDKRALYEREPDVEKLCALVRSFREIP